jgi:hypothetical protein
MLFLRQKNGKEIGFSTVEDSFRKWAISPRKQNIAKRFHSHPIGISVKAQKKGGWDGSLTLHSTEVKKRNTKPTASKLTVLRQLCNLIPLHLSIITSNAPN